MSNTEVFVMTFIAMTAYFIALSIHIDFQFTGVLDHLEAIETHLGIEQQVEEAP